MTHIIREINIATLSDINANPTLDTGPDSQAGLNGTPGAHTAVQLDKLAGLWNQSLGPEFALSPQHLAYRLQPPGATPSPMPARGLAVVTTAQEPSGLILVSAYRHASKTHVHIDGLAVHPEQQGRGIGKALVQWASDWAIEQRGTRLYLGSGPLRLLPGVPTEKHNAPGQRLGFKPVETTYYDLMADLSAYTPPESVVDVPAQARPATPGEVTYLQDYLNREVTAGERLGIEYFLAAGGRLSDIMLLWTDTGIQGLAQTTLEDSVGGIEPWFPYDLPKPWSALRLIMPRNIAPRNAEASFHRALLDAALRRLHNIGVNSCILWDVHEPTTHAEFGFKPYHEFQRCMNRTVEI